ncbi:MAG: hypothetical protein ACOVS5_06025 [Oligoflexus sp.]
MQALTWVAKGATFCKIPIVCLVKNLKANKEGVGKELWGAGAGGYGKKREISGRFLVVLQKNIETTMIIASYNVL